VYLSQAALAVALLAVAGIGWLLTDERMAGMDEGPGTDPGSLGFYVSVWIAMMVAMMLPSAAPMVVAHSAVQRRRRELGRHGGRGASVAFVAGYLLVWTAFGVLAYAVFELVRSLDVEAVEWRHFARQTSLSGVSW
jgi:predicted metal-binding membrane protein